MSHVVADLSDAHPHCPIVRPGLHNFGGHTRFFGPIKTLKVFEDNALVRAELEQAGHGAVLVVDGGGSQRCALVGGLLGELAVQNGWAGIVVNGCVRDVVELRDQPLGVRALASHPRMAAPPTWCCIFSMPALCPAIGCMPMRTASCSAPNRCTEVSERRPHPSAAFGLPALLTPSLRRPVRWSWHALLLGAGLTQ